MTTEDEQDEYIEAAIRQAAITLQWQAPDVSENGADHNLILTANGHGAGFWDRGLGIAGDQLTTACEPYSFDAEFRLWGDDADDDEHCSDELAWLMVGNEVLLDELGWSANA